jgi:polyhydroxybutyrate depolymerase
MNKRYLWLFFSMLSVAANGQLLHDSLQVDGRYRTFHYLQPTRQNPTLVFVLHGSGGSGQQIRIGAKALEDIAQSENLLLVYPDGYKKFWNECRKASNSAANVENVDENAFFEGMLTYFQQKYQHNPKRVFAVGTSGGGHMAYKLALTMPERFRAITAIIANLPDSSNLDCPEKRIAIPVLIINGTADPVNPYEGGEVNLGPTIKMGTVWSTERTVNYWASLAGYTGPPQKTTLPDTDPTDGKTIEQYSFSQPGKPEVTLLKVLGGRHDYPNDINVYQAAWAFFKRQQ